MKAQIISLLALLGIAPAAQAQQSTVGCLPHKNTELRCALEFWLPHDQQLRVSADVSAASETQGIVDVWYSGCGFPGSKIAGPTTIRGQASNLPLVNVKMPGFGSTCIEMFVHSCSSGGRSIACSQAFLGAVSFRVERW